MSTHNKQDALDLCDKLIATAKAIREGIVGGREDGLLVDVQCERLGVVISQLEAPFKNLATP
jgi:hypothetical protein